MTFISSDVQAVTNCQLEAKYDIFSKHNVFLKIKVSSKGLSLVGDTKYDFTVTF